MNQPIIRWLQTVAKIPGVNIDAAAKVFVDVVAPAYAEPHRRYHTMTHITDSFGTLDALVPETQRSLSLELALWFHDVVYDPKRTDNEHQSRLVLARPQGMSSQVSVRDAMDMIVMTAKHVNTARDSALREDAQRLLDVDCSILGAADSAFDDYCNQIEREYAWVPESAYVSKRIEILEAFLAREQLYGTAVFRAVFEEQARSNLGREIKRLRERQVIITGEPHADT